MFTDHTAMNRDVQIPANPFYAPTVLAAAITNLTLPYNITCTFNATTQFFPFTDMASAPVFTNWMFISCSASSQYFCK